MRTTAQARTILLAVQRHPNCMSALLLEYLLKGEVFGRMVEKGLLNSPYRGTFVHLPAEAISRFIEECVSEGWLVRASDFYPALTLSERGKAFLAIKATPGATDLSPEQDYKAYHRWRAAIARQMRKPPYRILPNAALNELAARRPVTLETLLGVPGLGKRRALRYQAGLLMVGRELRASESPVLA
jgi:superfamily II DNA helicase RecQ